MQRTWRRLRWREFSKNGNKRKFQPKWTGGPTPFLFLSLLIQKGKAVAALRRFWLTVDWQQGYIGSRQDALCFFPLVRALAQGAEICV